MTPRKARATGIVAGFLSCLVIVFVSPQSAQVGPSAATSSVCSPIPPPPCKDGKYPGVLRLQPDPSRADNKLKLAHQRFYLSTCPFDLQANGVEPGTMQSRRAYYSSHQATHELTEWLENNYCDTVYCREIRMDEVTCDVGSKDCVPEFVEAYRKAFEALRNREQALRWLTMYDRLASPDLRVGFYLEKKKWLSQALEKIRKGQPQNSYIQETITDKDANAFFYDLCPGTYYVSSIAPIEAGGTALYWEMTAQAKPITISESVSAMNAVSLTIAFPPGTDTSKKIFGKPVVPQKAVEQKAPPSINR